MKAFEYWILSLFLLIPFLFSLKVAIGKPQEVIVTLTAKQIDLPVELDVIVLENLTDPDTATLTDLPAGVTSYDIDLMKGKVIGGIEDPMPNSGISLTTSQPGLLKFILRVAKPGSFHFTLFELNGKAVVDKVIPVQAGDTWFTLQCTAVPFTILRISGDSFIACLRCPGNPNNSGITSLSAEQPEVSNPGDFKSSSLLFPESFKYTPGDVIEFKAFKSGWYSNYIQRYTHHLDSYTVYISHPCINQPVVHDYEGNTYATVQIGSQCWMRENLRSTRYSDGTPLVDGTGAGNIGGDCLTKYWFDYNDDPSISAEYGKLYTGSAAVNGDYSGESTKIIQGLCPVGWHVPRDMDWMRLEAFLGMGADTIVINEWRGTDQAFQLRATGYDHWETSFGTNKSGFNAYAAGHRHYYGEFSGTGGTTNWWGSMVSNDCYAFGGRHIASLMGGIMRASSSYSINGISVRCLKD